MENLQLTLIAVRKKKNSAWISRRLFLIYAVFLSNLFVQCSFMLIMSKRHWQTAYNRKENFNNFSHAHKEKLYIFHGNLISCTIWWQFVKWIQLLARWKNETIHEWETLTKLNEHRLHEVNEMYFIWKLRLSRACHTYYNRMIPTWAYHGDYKMKYHHWASRKRIP